MVKGGVFAGGFMSIHAGEIPINDVVEQLAAYLKGFGSIVELYRFWSEIDFGQESLSRILQGVTKRHFDRIVEDMSSEDSKTVYQAYNVATRYATHQMRSYRTAFDLLERIDVPLISRIELEKHPEVFGEGPL